ncbi:hypothetical protein GCM10020256_14490 [Streptomyces thermocoprophilus]
MAISNSGSRPIVRACTGYCSAHRPVMKIVAGTFSARSAAISSGLSKRSPDAARGPWSAVMSASKVSATVFSRPARGPCSNTGVSPAGPGARVGGRDASTDGAGWAACSRAGGAVAWCSLPQAPSAAARRQTAVTVRAVTTRRAGLITV